MFSFVGIYSVVFIPAFQRDKFRDRTIRRSLLVGGVLIALQAMCVVFTLSTFGDAARVNVVYSMRGIWGVLFVWLAASLWGGSESGTSLKTMLHRLFGAVLISVSVVLAIVYG